MITFLVFTLLNNFKIGRNNPFGVKAVTYMYSSDGFWKPLKNLDYTWDKYIAGNQNQTPGSQPHYLNPYEFDKAIQKGQYLTCLDSEGHLLTDFNMDGEIDSNAQSGYAFHSHNAKTGGNINHGTIKPEYSFFYDDNYLGRIIASTYGTDIPFGLPLYSTKTKWDILTGRNAPSYLYIGEASMVKASDYALNGIYNLDKNQIASATSIYNSLITFLSPTYNFSISVWEFSFQNLSSNYELALTLIFVSFYYNTTRDSNALQYMISLRSIVLTRQQQSTTVYSASVVKTGWINDAGVLAFKETALAIIALGVGFDLTFEYNFFPIVGNPGGGRGVQIQNHQRVTSVSQGGWFDFGPYIDFPLGVVNAEFYMRCVSGLPSVKFDTNDNSNGIHNNVILITITTCDTNWTLVQLPNFNIVAAPNQLEFRVSGHTQISVVDLMGLKINYISFNPNPPCSVGQTYILNNYTYKVNYYNYGDGSLYSNQCVSSGFPSQLTNESGTASYSTCPAGTTTVGNRCIACASGYYDTTQKLDAYGNFNTASYTGNRVTDWPCVGSCTLRLGTTCVSSCPDGYINSAGVCTLCGTGLISNGTTCVLTCPSPKYTFKKSCYTACPSYTYTVEAKKECVLYCAGMYFIWQNVCT